jgi:hypothetical protein
MATATALEVMPQQPIQRRTLEPTTLAEAKEFADIASKSELVPKDYQGKAYNVLIAIQFGKELGVQPMQALQGIAVVNGRPAVWGDLALAIVMAHPDFVDIEEDDFSIIKSAGKATCIITRRGRKPVQRSFSKEDATRANLTSKSGPWMQYPERMLQMRARGFAIRDAFPDAMKGLVTAEEAGDYHDGPTIDAGHPSHSPQSFDTVAAPADDKLITQDQAREFGKAWKASGKTIEEAKTFLRESFSLDSSLKLRDSQFAKAMAWANQAPAATSPAAETTVASPDKKLAFELFAILGYDAVKQAKTVQLHNSDWVKIVAALNSELPEES